MRNSRKEFRKSDENQAIRSIHLEGTRGILFHTPPDLAFRGIADLPSTLREASPCLVRSNDLTKQAEIAGQRTGWASTELGVRRIVGWNLELLFILDWNCSSFWNWSCVSTSHTTPDPQIKLLHDVEQGKGPRLGNLRYGWLSTTGINR